MWTAIYRYKALLGKMRLLNPIYFQKLGFLTLLFIVLFFAFFYISDIMHSGIIDDVGAFVYTSKLISENNVPYKDFVLPHAPLPFFIVAKAFDLFGVSLLLSNIISVLFALIAIIFVYLIGKEFYDIKVGLLSAFLFGINFRIFRNARISLEYIYIICFIIIALYFFLRAYFKQKDLSYLICGVFIGLAFISKYYAFFSLVGFAAFFIYLLATKQSSIKYIIKKFLILNTGFSLPCFIFLIYLFLNDAIYDWFYQNFLMTTSVGFFPVRVIYDVYRLMKDNTLIILLSLSIMFSAFLFNKKREIILFSQALCLLFFLFIPRMLFISHYYMFFAPFVILGSYSFISLFRKYKKLSIRIFLILFLMSTIFFNIENNIMEINNAEEIEDMFINQVSKSSMDQLINTIHENSGEDDYLFTDYPMINFLSKRKAPPSLIAISLQMVLPCTMDASYIIDQLVKYDVSLVLIHADNKGKKIRGSSIPHHIVNMCHYSDFKEYLTDNYLFLKQQNINDMVFDVYVKKTTAYNH